MKSAPAFQLYRPTAQPHHSRRSPPLSALRRRVAELSLLGGLGCGRWLVQCLLEELAVEGKYDYVVLQVRLNNYESVES